MIKTARIFFMVFLLACGINLWAQQKAGKKTAAKTAAKSNTGDGFFLLPHIYLGNDFSGGEIGKKDFNAKLKGGFTAHDSLGNKYQIVGFNFTYAERNLYEDSIGNLQVLVDFMNEYCAGDTVTTNISETIYQRIKAGDTVYVDHVTLRPYPGNTVLAPEDTAVLTGKGMKCVIIK